MDLNWKVFLLEFGFHQFLLSQLQSDKGTKTINISMDLIIFIVGFIIFVLHLIAFLTIIYRQNKIQDEELDNDPELNK